MKQAVSKSIARLQTVVTRSCMLDYPSAKYRFKLPAVLLFLTFIIFYPSQSFSQMSVENQTPPKIELPAGATVSSIVTNILEHGDLSDTAFIAGQLGITQSQYNLIDYIIKSPDPMVTTYVLYNKYDVNADYSAFVPNYKLHTIATFISGDISNKPCIDPLSFQKLFPNPPTTSPSHYFTTSVGKVDYNYTKPWGGQYMIDFIASSSHSCVAYAKIVFRLRPTSQQGDK